MGIRAKVNCHKQSSQTWRLKPTNTPGLPAGDYPHTPVSPPGTSHTRWGPSHTNSCGILRRRAELSSSMITDWVWRSMCTSRMQNEEQLKQLLHLLKQQQWRVLLIRRSEFSGREPGRDVYLSLLHLAPCPAAAPVRSVTSSSSSSAGRGAAALMFAIACARTLKGFSPEKPSGRDRQADFGILPKSAVWANLKSTKVSVTGPVVPRN
jgi:hypothetical protein